MPRIPILVHRDFVPNSALAGRLNRRATDLAAAKKHRQASFVRAALVVMALGAATILAMRYMSVDIGKLARFMR